MIAGVPPPQVRPGDDGPPAVHARPAIAELRRIRSSDPAAAAALRAVRLAANTIERYVTCPLERR